MEPNREDADFSTGGEAVGLDLQGQDVGTDRGSVLDGPSRVDAPEVPPYEAGSAADLFEAKGPLGDASPDARALPDGYVRMEDRLEDTTWGAPEDDAWYWLFQGYGTGTCGATSVAMVIADMLDTPLASNQEVVDQAVALGVLHYDPSNPQWQTWGGWSGMTTTGVEALLESYGVGATVYGGAHVGHLASYLEAGQPAIVMVDGEEIWQGADDDATDSGQAPNHFVQVIGVDYVEQVVYLNDPAIENGAGLAVPMSLFEDAWQDSGNAVIMTDRPLESAVPVGAGAVRGDPGATPGSAGLPEPNGRGTVLLGFTLCAVEGTWMVPDRSRR
jgi:uncharacterized protein YvpB